MLELAPGVDFQHARFYYFAHGEVRRVPPNRTSAITPQ